MPTTRARTRHTFLRPGIALLVLLGLTLNACGTAESPAEGTPSSSAATADPTDSSSDPNAGGHPAEVDGGGFLVPPDWGVEKSDTGLNLQAPTQRQGGARVGGGSLASSSNLDLPSAIDDAADSALAFHKNGSLDKVERLPDVTFGGVTFYHVRGDDSARWLDDYGTVHNGQLISVLWMFNRGMVDRKQTDEMINQVMTTFEPTS